MYLILSILSSTLIFVVFKLFATYRITTFHAIVFNYITAGLCGLFLYDQSISIQYLIGAPWFYYALGLGVLFISVFYLMAITTKLNGLTTVSIATKMSFVIPVCIGFFFLKERINVFTCIGLGLAISAIYLTSNTQTQNSTNKKPTLWLPFLVFIGSGIIDASLKLLETTKVGPNEIPIFSATIFLAAASIGTIGLTYSTFRNKSTINTRSILGGITLGVLNFSSVFFLIKALRHTSLESAKLFTLNNIAIVLLSTLVAWFIFKEKLTLKNHLGIILAIASILIVSLL